MTPTRFYGPAQLGATPATLYTSPASTISTVRHIHASNPTDAAVWFTLSIGTDANGTRVMDQFTMPPNSVLDHFVYYPLAATQILQARAQVASTVVLVVSGDTEPDGVG